MAWVSVGFPRVAGKKDAVRQPFDMKGSVFSTLDINDRFPIDATAGPKTEEDWKGASGSPVFVNWRILGVVVSVPEKLGAKRLWAVPMWRVLREDAEFRAKIGWDRREARRASVLKKLTAALEPSPAALEALIREIPGCPRDLAHESARKKAGDVARCLLDLEVDQVVRVCKKAHGAVDSRTDAAAVTAAIQIILPAVYDHGVVEGVRTARGEAIAAFLTLPAHFPTVAEIIMAGVDRRATLFCPREREDHFPKGRLSLPEPPEGGFDADGQRALDALNTHLAAKFSL
ncbi:MAG: hypothetical protein M3Z21_15145, partial [Pseudomonadota bacterium]|nr:hypothetical protein [Pseudomonadota bacterium]